MKTKFIPNYETLKTELEKTFVIDGNLTDWLDSLGLIINETLSNGELSISVINEEEMKCAIESKIKLGEIPEYMNENEYIQESHEILERELAQELVSYISSKNL